jgi:hypothetical protein
MIVINKKMSFMAIASVVVTYMYSLLVGDYELYYHLVESGISGHMEILEIYIAFTYIFLGERWGVSDTKDTE